MDVTELERTVDHQRKVWTNLYGPAKAATLAEQFAALLTAQPDLDPKAAAAQIDPDDDEDYEDFVAARW
jgi:hypothetical protein